MRRTVAGRRTATRRGAFAEALQWMERPRALDPGHAETRQRIEELRRALGQPAECGAMLSPTVANLFANPYHMRALADAGVVGCSGERGEGPYCFLYLLLDGDTVTEAAFETHPCPSAIACGSWMCAWLEGRTLRQAAALTAPALRAVLGGLPEGKEACADLAVDALARALRKGGQ